jgi:hypothetical protein
MNKNQHYRITRIFNALLVTFFSAGIFGLFTITAVAQSGTIRGKVVADIPDQRKILPSVLVTLSGDRLGDKKLQSVSDLEGQYDFPSLVAGEYLLTVEFSGFKKYEKKLSVQIEATVEHDILLQPVPLTESVTYRSGFARRAVDRSKVSGRITFTAGRHPWAGRQSEHQGHATDPERHSRVEFERHRSGHRRAGD